MVAADAADDDVGKDVGTVLLTTDDKFNPNEVGVFVDVDNDEPVIFVLFDAIDDRFKPEW